MASTGGTWKGSRFFGPGTKTAQKARMAKGTPSTTGRKKMTRTEGMAASLNKPSQRTTNAPTFKSASEVKSNVKSVKLVSETGSRGGRYPVVEIDMGKYGKYRSASYGTSDNLKLNTLWRKSPTTKSPSESISIGNKSLDKQLTKITAAFNKKLAKSGPMDSKRFRSVQWGSMFGK